MNHEALRAFDNCPNRVAAQNKTNGNLGRTVCARYPDGVSNRTSYVHDIFDDATERGVFAKRLGCAACPYKDKHVSVGQLREPFEGYHTEIVEHCKPRFDVGHYDDAVLAGTKLVRDRLRDLTGFETAAEAFGRGGLIVAGSANSHTENNFHEGARFIMMGMDRFRNELAHTIDQNDLIKQPGIALHFLGNCSLSMYLLDGARVEQ